MAVFAIEDATPDEDDDTTHRFELFHVYDLTRGLLREGRQRQKRAHGLYCVGLASPVGIPPHYFNG
jgi:hypothetical protein